MKPALTSATVVVTVLVASVAVAALLAGQATSAVRSRPAVSEAMLREYAQLAAWEFSREARKDVDNALMHALAGQIHPERHMGNQPVSPKPGAMSAGEGGPVTPKPIAKAGGEGGCDCAVLFDVDHWFEIPRDGAVRSRAGAIPPATLDALARYTTRERGGAMEGNGSGHPKRSARLVSVEGDRPSDRERGSDDRVACQCSC